MKKVDVVHYSCRFLTDLWCRFQLKIERPKAKCYGYKDFYITRTKLPETCNF